MGETLRDWQVERHLLGELPAPEAAAVSRAIAEDPGLRGRVEALEASNRLILAAHPPRLAASVIRARAAATRPAAAAWGRPRLLAAASLAVLVAGLAVLQPRPAALEAPAETRIKGLRPHLAVFRQTAAGVEALEENALTHEGDLVQLAYQAAGRRFGAVLSIDGRGAVTLHHPRDARSAAALATDAPAPLPSAYRLDDAPGWERFFLVTADEPFALDAVVAAARRLAARGTGDTEPLSLPPDMEQSSFTLSKDGRR
jgi:hypothetical protein